jgi:hypothetical protein
VQAYSDFDCFFVFTTQIFILNFLSFILRVFFLFFLIFIFNIFILCDYRGVSDNSILVYLSHILSYYIYIAKIHELNYINFLNSSTPTYQATSRRKKQKICSGRIPPLNLCQATSRRKKKQKGKRFAFAKFHLFVPSNYFIEKKAKRLSFAEFYPFVPSNFQEKKRKK